MNRQEVFTLLQEYASILNRLNAGGIVRTYNSPVGDYAEWIVKETMNLILEPNSNAGYDAVDDTGIKYQIKSRWLHEGQQGLQKLGIIRDYEKHDFDYLILVIFNKDFTIHKVFQWPHESVKDIGKYNKRLNGYQITITERIFKDPRAVDLTEMFSG